MRLHYLATILVSTFIFVPASVGQTEPPADGKPAIQGEIGYTMPQVVIDAEISGTVRVGVRVEESGKVDKVWIIAGPMWPCGKTPKKAIDKLEDSLSGAIKTVKFTPAIRNGTPATENVALTIQLENPKVTPAAVNADPVTGRVSPKMASMGVLNGRAISMPKPAYPAEARAVRAGGTVSVQVLIDEEGTVKRAGALSGAPELQYAARDAACGAKFSPTKLKDDPIKVSGVITYNFVPGPMR